MTQGPIENPVINSPYVEPVQHFVTTADGTVTGEIEPRRRPSEFFVPVARPKKLSGQMTIDAFGGPKRQQPNEIVNEIRQAVARWRLQDHPHITSTTRDLIRHWRDEDRERRLFFCQLEAAETAIYLTEAAEKLGDTKALNVIREENATHNGGLPRIAFKMATGSGKTVLMAMLIAWQALNRAANPQDRRFSDRFLIITPGITIRDRLRVLYPNDTGNFYKALDIVSPEQLDRLQSATILVTNFHAFLRRDKIQAASLTKKVLSGFEDDERFRETPPEMVRRVCRVFGNAKNIVVLNDEAHHCYAPAPRDESQEGSLDVDERIQASKDLEEARVWLSGVQAVRDKLGIRAVYDLSATPFFLKGSGYAEGTLFPWVVSDFGLMDAIESGIVKIPRVPVSDDSMTGEGPMYRDLWFRVRDALPRKGIRDTPIDGLPVIPKELEGALRSLYADYERSHQAWADAGMGTPPVFIVVCSNTATSKLVSDWIAGWEKELPDGTRVVVPGNLELFSNEQEGRYRDRPNTILVDSAQLDRGDALDPAFRKAAAAEIERFKHEYVIRFPGRSAEDITDEEILREVMNTVGKVGRLGEHVRCVVSVAMLTEGWDASDPGDLILDPTCGSGTTAYVAEQWRRRWITIDTSRVALGLARSRLMAAKYPWYLLADSEAGTRKEAELTGQAPPSPLPPTANDVRRGFVYERVPHVTLKSIAQNPEIHEGMSREEINATIARHAESETLFDRPYEDRKIVRVSGPFTVESLSPHRVMVDGPEDAAAAETVPSVDAGAFVTSILDNLRRAGVQNTKRAERLEFARLDPYPGTWVQGAGEYGENGSTKTVAVAIGPEFGTVGPELIRDAAKEAVKFADLLVVCGFAFDPLAGEEASTLGRLTILQARMNPDLAMGDELLKKTGSGNLFMVFGEPDIDVREAGEGRIEVEVRGLDVYDPTTGVLRSSSVDDIAAWFLDTNYDGDAFFVRHAYFTGGDDPYDKLRRALRADISDEAWATINSTVSRPFPRPKTGKVAVKVINHYGDEVMKVYGV